MSSTSLPPRLKVNANTLLMDAGASRGGGESAEQVFRIVQPAAARVNAPPGALVVASVTGMGAVRTAVLAPGAFLVVGRHTSCGLGIEDPCVSLRHLVLRASQGPSGPRVHLWDLRTSMPVVAEDGSPTRALVAEQALFARIGRAALWVMPATSWGTEASAAWNALPPRRFERVLGTEPTGLRSIDRRITVTHTLPPVPFGEDPDVALCAGQIDIELPFGKVSRRVSTQQLDRGLLFGRYDRCQLSLDGDTELSRVHLFIVRIDGQLWAVDTASTNGTRHNGAQVAAIGLGAAASLLLAKRCIVRWQQVQPVVS